MHCTYLLFTISVIASALGGMLGMAGGIFIVPILTASGVGIRTAVAASIVSVIACSCGGSGPSLRQGLTNIRLATVLELSTTLGALTGVLLAGVLPTRGSSSCSRPSSCCRRTGCSFAVTSRSGRARPEPNGWGSSLRLHSSYADPGSGTDVAYVVQRVPAAMALMFGAGVVSALLGIGSGVLKIPAMDAALGLPLKVSSATSNFMIGVTAAASAGAYFARGDIVPAIAGPVAIGSVLGAILGARILLALPTERIRLLFVGVLRLLAVQMLLAAFGVPLFGARRERGRGEPWIAGLPASSSASDFSRVGRDRRRPCDSRRRADCDGGHRTLHRAARRSCGRHAGRVYSAPRLSDRSDLRASSWSSSSSGWRSACGPTRRRDRTGGRRRRRCGIEAKDAASFDPSGDGKRDHPIARLAVVPANGSESRS